MALTRFGTRVWTYLALLRDEYPSTAPPTAQRTEQILDYLQTTAAPSRSMKT